MGMLIVNVVKCGVHDPYSGPKPNNRGAAHGKEKPPGYVSLDNIEEDAPKLSDGGE
jgi:hypothetical protein